MLLIGTAMARPKRYAGKSKNYGRAWMDCAAIWNHTAGFPLFKTSLTRLLPVYELKYSVIFAF